MRNDNLLLRYPVRMRPVFKDYFWGGDKLAREWGKKSPYAITAESWELSAHRNGQSTADNGPLAGKTLGEVIEAFGRACLGTRSGGSGRFPILIKLIDPRQSLSVQVHPDDAYALEHEGDQGKTEMWYIADPGETGSILCGFREDISPEQFREATADHSLPGLMNRIPVRRGDAYFIRPGTVHAIGADLIIAEIQQNSDVTYRVYDFGRKNADGTGRTLHLEKAADVSDLRASSFDGRSAGGYREEPFGTTRLLASCAYFQVTEYRVSRGSAHLFAGSDSFHALLFLEGSGVIRHAGTATAFSRGETFFIPADMRGYDIEGESLFLLTRI